MVPQISLSAQRRDYPSPKFSFSLRSKANFDTPSGGGWTNLREYLERCRPKSLPERTGYPAHMRWRLAITNCSLVRFSQLMLKPSSALTSLRE